MIGILELMKTKQREDESATNFITILRGLTLECLQKFTQQELVCMSLNNLRHDLSIVFMPQTFKGFNGLCTKVLDIEST